MKQIKGSTCPSVGLLGPAWRFKSSRGKIGAEGVRYLGGASQAVVLAFTDELRFL